MDRDAIEYTRQHYDAHANKMSTVEVRRKMKEKDKKKENARMICDFRSNEWVRQ